MTDDQLDDLKLFIDTRLSQTETTLRSEMDAMKAELTGRMGTMESGIQQLSDRMDNGFTGIGEIIEQINDRMDATEKATNKRLATLEQQAA